MGGIWMVDRRDERVKNIGFQIPLGYTFYFLVFKNY
jgi:hypothetical protein